MIFHSLPYTTMFDATPFDPPLYFLTAVCRASGDPHYTTFDGVSYSFQGVCSYILSRAKDRSFQIITENVKCGSTDVSCTKSVQISIRGQEINLVRGKEGVNGTGDNTYQLSDIVITKQSFWTSIHAPSDNLTILWDGGRFPRFYLQQ